MNRFRSDQYRMCARLACALNSRAFDPSECKQKKEKRKNGGNTIECLVAFLSIQCVLSFCRSLVLGRHALLFRAAKRVEFTSCSHRFSMRLSNDSRVWDRRRRRHSPLDFIVVVSSLLSPPSCRTRARAELVTARRRKNPSANR